jgi:hypothetical protein
MAEIAARLREQRLRRCRMQMDIESPPPLTISIWRRSMSAGLLRAVGTTSFRAML